MSLPNTFSIPPKIITPYQSIVRHKTTTASLDTGSKTITCQSINMQSIPEKILIWAQKATSDLTPADSDSFLPIESCRISFNNKDGLLSGCKQFDLYKLSVDNGLQMDYLTWRGIAAVYNAGVKPNDVLLSGRPLILSPAKDLSLDEVLINNSMGQFNLLVDITVKNNFTAATKTDTYIVFIYNAYLNCQTT